MPSPFVEDKEYINIPCPVCKGTGQKFDTSAREYVDQPCTACKGSKRYIYDAKEEMQKARQKQAESFLSMHEARAKTMKGTTNWKDFVCACERSGLGTFTRRQTYQVRRVLKKHGYEVPRWDYRSSKTLTEKEVQEIKKAVDNKVTQKDLAEKYGVSATTIYRVINGQYRIWR